MDPVAALASRASSVPCPSGCSSSAASRRRSRHRTWRTSWRCSRSRSARRSTGPSGLVEDVVNDFTDQRKDPMKIGALFLLVAGQILAILKSAEPELKRYMKMREM